MRYEIQLPDNKSLKIRQMVMAYVRGGEIPPVSDADGSDVRVTWCALQALADAKRMGADAVTTIDAAPLFAASARAFAVLSASVAL